MHVKTQPNTLISSQAMLAAQDSHCPHITYDLVRHWVRPGNNPDTVINLLPKDLFIQYVSMELPLYAKQDYRVVNKQTANKAKGLGGHHVHGQSWRKKRH